MRIKEYKYNGSTFVLDELVKVHSFYGRIKEIKRNKDNVHTTVKIQLLYAIQPNGLTKFENVIYSDICFVEKAKEEIEFKIDELTHMIKQYKKLLFEGGFTSLVLK